MEGCVTVSQKETWPFSIRLLLLNKVNEIVRNSKQPEFYVEKKDTSLVYQRIL